MSKNMGITGTWLTVNRVCNFRCSWCYAIGTKYSKEDDMSLSTAKSLVKISSDVGVDEIIYIGGEPTLWPNLWEIDKFVHNLDMVSAIVTNGYLVGFDDFAHKLSESNIDFINISLKAGNPRQHAQLTNVSEETFSYVEKGIRNAVSMDKGVNVSIVVSDLVLDNLEELVDISVSNGVNDVFLQLCTPEFSDGEAHKGGMIEPHILTSTLEKKYPKMNKLTRGKIVIEGTVPLCSWDPDFLQHLLSKNQLSLGCQLRSRSGVIFDPNGSVLLCNHLYNYPVGKFGTDFDDDESFVAYWTSKKLSDINKEICAYPSVRCIECNDFTLCGGGCPLQWFVYDPEDILIERR